MRSLYHRRYRLCVYLAMGIILLAGLTRPAGSNAGDSAGDASKPDQRSIVKCARFVYGKDQPTACFSDVFLAQVQSETNIRTKHQLVPVKLESARIYEHPFAVMTGSGSFILTPDQRMNLKRYLTIGGFLLASPSCSSSDWDRCFRAEIKRLFPELKLQRLPAGHRIFRNVYDIKRLKARKVGRTPQLLGLKIEGRLVMIYSRQGLNDTAETGPSCCCCGGNEILNARQINVNALAYALTH